MNYDIQILLQPMKLYLILINIQELVTHWMEVKMTNLENAKIEKRNQIIQIENYDELYLDNDYVTSSDSDE